MGIEKRYIKVAGHVFSVSGEAETLALMENYEPFGCEEESTVVFSLTIAKGAPVSYEEEFRQDDEGNEIACGRTAEGKPVFEFYWRGEKMGWLVCSPDYHDGHLFTTDRHTKTAIDNTLMLLFALATANRQTVLFHAAVVSHLGRGYMFLGPSGTGKSTHARLWLKYIEGSELINDDNPVVRITDDGAAVVYGSPWSGKTPCYRNVSFPLGSIIRLSQASYNKIQRLSGIEAYVALVESISGKRWDSKIADGLHQSENVLATSVPMWHLACLPNQAAAELCQMTVK